MSAFSQTPSLSPCQPSPFSLHDQKLTKINQNEKNSLTLPSGPNQSSSSHIRYFECWMLSPSNAIYFKACHWPWDHMISCTRRCPVFLLSGRRWPVLLLSDRRCPVFLLSSLTCMEVLTLKGPKIAPLAQNISSHNLFGFSWYRCYYPHTPRESVSPSC